MNRKIKILILAAIASLVCAGVKAQSVSYSTNNLEIFTVLTNGATYAFAGTNFVDMTRNTEVAFEFALQGTNANTALATVTFVRALSSNRWETIPSFAVQARANGTTPVVSITNWNVGAAGYIKPYQVSFAAATDDATNVTLKAFVKGYRRDQ